MVDAPPSPPTVLLGRRQLRRTVQRLGEEIGAAHPEGVVLVSVLKGSVLFLADLARVVAVPVEIDFLAISAFAPDSGRVRLVKDLTTDVSGRAVVLVEDVVDTGLSLAFLLGVLRQRGPSSLEVCALLDKTARRLVPTPIRYRGAEVPDVFALGYGLDYAGRYRNLEFVVAGDPAVLAADPDAYLGHLYRARSGPGAAGPQPL